MSFFRSLAQIAAPIVGGIFGGPAGAAIGAGVSQSLQKKVAAPAMVPPPSPTGFGGFSLTPTMSALPSGGNGFRTVSRALPAMGALPPLGRMLPAIGFGAGVAVARAGSIARAAGALCLKHPAWCANIGGTAAIIALMESGQIPVPKRRRGRGLTPRDLRSFRRVASLVRGFCPTVRRIPSRAIHARRTGIVHA